MPASEPPQEHRVLPGYSDTELVERLRRPGAAAEVLWSLAGAVLCGRGKGAICAMVPVQINAKLADLLAKAQPGRHFRLCPSELAHLDEWVGEAVVWGWDKFRRDTLRGVGWDPHPPPGTARAALTTWVINGMVLQIPDVVERQRRQAQHGPEEVLTPPDMLTHLLAAHGSRYGDPEAAAIAKDLLARVLASMPRDLARAVRMHVETGLSTAACCRELGLSPKAIEGQLRRWRRTWGGGGRHRRPEEPT